jgi:DNA modification methylase
MQIVRGRPPRETAFQTSLGRMLRCDFSSLLQKKWFSRLRGQVQLIFTSPPFPLNRKKSYGNLTGDQYVTWLSSFAGPWRELLTEDGSIVVELGNAWEPGVPAMSTLPMEALLAFKRAGDFTLCQEFIWHNPSRLPTPAQWVNVKRVRVKDSFTRFWWFAKGATPKADNRRVLVEYSRAMKQLIRTGAYNSGERPSQHSIGTDSFARDNGGAIPPNVLVVSNTRARTDYLSYCRRIGLRPHPARMPEELPEFFIKMLTDPDDIVMDPFAGSNTTGAVAERLGRQWISTEVDVNFIRGAVGRFPSTISFIEAGMMTSARSGRTAAS